MDKNATLVLKDTNHGKKIRGNRLSLILIKNQKQKNEMVIKWGQTCFASKIWLKIKFFFLIKVKTIVKKLRENKYEFWKKKTKTLSNRV